MPQLRYVTAAIRDLERLREFLRPKNPAVARQAAQTILKALQVLRLQPGMSRPIDGLPDEFREWVIDFGSSGYVARDRIDEDAITVLALRHQKEAGF